MTAATPRVQAVGGTFDLFIPPSILMVPGGVASGELWVDMLLAGLVPGLFQEWFSGSSSMQCIKNDTRCV